MARFKTGDIVAYRGSPWKVSALHSVGRGGWSDDAYDLKSVKTGVVVRDIPEWDIGPKNTLPIGSNIRSRNAVVQRALNAVSVAEAHSLPIDKAGTRLYVGDAASWING